VAEREAFDGGVIAEQDAGDVRRDGVVHWSANYRIRLDFVEA
jgi:hypothetical protein